MNAVPRNRWKENHSLKIVIITHFIFERRWLQFNQRALFVVSGIDDSLVRGNAVNFLFYFTVCCVCVCAFDQCALSGSRVLFFVIFGHYSIQFY